MRSLLVTVLAAAAAGSLTVSASAQCVTGGSGGLIPASGTGGGALVGGLPPTPAVFTLDVTTLPAGAALSEVKLNGLTHTWASDLTVVLTDPSGASTVLWEEAGSAAVTCNFNGNYSIVPQQPTPLVFDQCPVDADYLPGSYQQHYGQWPNLGIGTILKTPMHTILPQVGTWTLTVYDWAGGDTGALVDWELCFGAAVPPPAAPAACTGGTDLTTQVPGNTFGSLNGSNIFDLNVTAAGGINLSQIELNNNFTDNGFLLDIWTRPGTAFGNTASQAGWTLQATGVSRTDAVVGTPTVVEFTDFNIPTGLHGVMLVARGCNFFYRGAASSTTSVSNADITITTVGAQNIPFGGTLFTPRQVSATLRYNCGPAIPPIVTYCTAGTTTNGCNASLASSAQPSATNATSPVFTASNVEGAKQGLMFYGLNNTGFTPIPWAAGSSSFLCVKSPTQRFPNQTATGTANQCNGTLTQDFVAWETANPTAIGQPFAAGQKFYVQAWFRDPAAPKTTNLSNAIELTFIP